MWGVGGDFILHAHQQVKTARASNLLHPLAGACACHTSPQTAPSRRASRPRREGKKNKEAKQNSRHQPKVEAPVFGPRALRLR